MPQRSLLNEVNKMSMQARLISRAVKEVVFPNFFSLTKVDSLKWETLIGEKGVPVMADVISYDASAPEKKREVVSKASGDIPKTALKRSMNESEYLKYRNLRAKVQGRSDLSDLLDLVFKDLDFVYNGVRARMEFLSMQVLSTGTLELTNENNNGMITKTAVDFGVPSDNKKAVSTVWSSSSTAKPLNDLEELFYTARDKGVTGQYFIMDRPTFRLLQNADDTSSRVKNYINQRGNFALTLDVINSYMVANDLPQIVVIDPVVRFEGNDHERTIVRPYKEGRVVMVADRQVGSIQHGPIAAEESAELKKYATLVKQGFVLTSKWATLDPFKEWTAAEANAFPVLDDPEELFFLRTDNTSYSA